MTRPAAGRRFLIAVGVGEFEDPDISPLPEAVPDADRFAEPLCALGYERVLIEVSDHPRADRLRRAIGRWQAEQELGPQDIVVVYFAGHGVKERDRHYLVCRDTEQADWLSTGLASEDLARALFAGGAGAVLVVLDVCYAGSGADDLVVLAAELANRIERGAGRAVLATARRKDTAREKAFVDAASSVFAAPRSGTRAEYLTVPEMAVRINEYLESEGLPQRVRHSVVGGDGTDRFFPNPAHVAGVRGAGLDAATIRALRDRAAGHFDARGRGVHQAAEPGDLFTGRTDALAAIREWLGDDSRQGLAVTGDPGSGKSAVLGHVVRGATRGPGRAGPEQAEPRPDGSGHAESRPDGSAHTESGPSGSEQTGSGRNRRAPVASELGGSEPDGSASGTFAPPGHLHANLWASRAHLDELVEVLCAELSLPSTGLDDLLVAIRRLPHRVLVVADALDEAGVSDTSPEPRIIAQRLLVPLAALPNVKVLVGTRRQELRDLGSGFRHLDLDEGRYADPRDIVDYARALLLDRHDPDSRSAYRDRPAEAAVVADGIARRAGRSFLVAGMTARGVVRGRLTIDTTVPRWEDAFPEDAKSAFEEYLDRFGVHRERVTRLMRPLAFAQGAGLSWSTVWAQVAEALSGTRCTNSDIKWLLEHAGEYIVETVVEGTSVFRLFHETMAETLRDPRRDADDHRAIAAALRPERDESIIASHWQSSAPYVRAHIASHAAAGNDIDTYLTDPGFLIHTSPRTLARAVGTASTPEARRTAAVYRASFEHHEHVQPDTRRDVIGVDAARFADPELAEKLTLGRPVRPRWATGSLVQPRFRMSLTGAGGGIVSLAVMWIDGQQAIVAGCGNGTIRVWHAGDGVELFTMKVSDSPLVASHAMIYAGRPQMVTVTEQGPLGSPRGIVQVWDLISRSLQSTIEVAQFYGMVGTALVAVGREPYILVATANEVFARRLRDGDQLGTITNENGRRTVSAVTAVTLRGEALAVIGYTDSSVERYQIEAPRQGRTEPSQVAPHPARAVAYAVSGDKTIKAIGYDDGTATVTIEDTARPGYDLWYGSISSPETSAARTLCPVDDRRFQGLIIGCHNGTVGIMDWTKGTSEATTEFLTGHTASVRAAAYLVLDGRPHAVTGDGADSVRIWDLTDDVTGHSLVAGHVDDVRGVTHILDGETGYAISASHDGTSAVWRLAGKDPKGAQLRRYDDTVNAVACTELQGKPVAVFGVGVTTTVEDLSAAVGRPKDYVVLQPPRLATTPTEKLAVACISIDDTPHAVIGCDNGEVRLWNLNDRRAVLSQYLGQHDGTVTSVACAAVAGRPHALSGGDDAQIHLWDLSDLPPLPQTLSGHESTVWAVAFGRVGDKTYAISGGTDQDLRIWDLSTPRIQCHVLPGHKAQIWSITTTHINGRCHVLSGDDNGALHVWDLATGTSVATHTMPLSVLALSARGTEVVVGMASEVVVLDLDPALFRS